MSALSVQVPFPVFQDSDGQPLENGYIWIGEPNLNPQTNPVIAYYDEALTIVAAQPLRTINGYISRAGTPAQIYINGVSFSILVQDSKGSMVYNFPDGSGISPDACGVTYDPPFTGSVPYPVCEKLAETVSAQDFGVTGNGTTNDTAAIQTAINACTSSGKTLFFPAGTYLFTSQLVFTCDMQGESNQATIFQASGLALSTTDYAMCIGANSGVTRRIKAGGFFLKGDGLTIANNGLRINSVWFSRFQSIRVGNFYGTGIKVKEESYWNTYEDIEAGRDNESVTNTPDIGLDLAGVVTGGVTSSTFTGCYFSGRTYGVTMTYADNLVFNNLEVTGAPIGFNCPLLNTNIVVNALYAELNTTACIQGGSNSLYINGLSDTASTTAYIGTAPTWLMKRAGLINKTFSLGSEDFFSSWNFNYVDSGSHQLVISNGRSGIEAVQVQGASFSANAATSSLSPQAYHQLRRTADTGEKVLVLNDDFSGDFVEFYNARGGVNATGANAAAASIKVGNPAGGRSINASGTINASGADYAEYMTKAGDFTIAKGDVCGINANGLLTNVFDEAVTFVVKSTNPSYVGGDTWGRLEIVGHAPAEPVLESGDDEDIQNRNSIKVVEYKAAKAVYDAKVEAERVKVDRVAFAGQVPVNVYNASAGQYIIAMKKEDGGIQGAAVSSPTFEQYQASIGKVIAIEADGQARIIVKIA
jgi:hypothetical protein